MRALKSNAPRLLFKLVQTLASRHPRATVQSILLPLLLPAKDGGTSHANAGVGVGSSQVELVNRVTKACMQGEERALLLRAFASGDAADGAHDPAPGSDEQDIVLDDTTLPLLHTLLSGDLSPKLNDALFGQLLSAMERALSKGVVGRNAHGGREFNPSKSLKFWQVVQKLVTKHAAAARPHTSRLRAMLSSCDTVRK